MLLQTDTYVWVWTVKLCPFVDADHPWQLACPLYVTSPRDPCTWPLCSSTQFVELGRLNTSSRFCQKRNFFGAPKIRSVSTWRITWLLLFTLSIPLDQSSMFTRLIILNWTYKCLFLQKTDEMFQLHVLSVDTLYKVRLKINRIIVGRDCTGK